MTNEIFSRLEMLIGKESIEKLSKSHIVVFGVGGVGSFAVEALARSGVGKLTLIDFDTFSLSNLNRQLQSNLNTIGKDKLEITKERILSINPECEVILKSKLAFKNIEDFFEEDEKYDFVIDCIDVIYSKVELIEYCFKNNIQIISSMGFGNKLEPEKVQISSLNETTVCPMARLIRKELRRKKNNNIVDGLMTVFSKEKPLKPNVKLVSEINDELPFKITPGSSVFVPGTAGLMLASYVFRKLIAN